MSYECTKLLVRFFIRDRLFRIFDRDKPFELYSRFRIDPPETSGGSGLGVGLIFFHFTDVGKTNYSHDKIQRVKSLDEASEIVEKLKNGYCFECGDVSKCRSFTLSSEKN